MTKRATVKNINATFKLTKKGRKNRGIGLLKYRQRRKQIFKVNKISTLPQPIPKPLPTSKILNNWQKFHKTIAIRSLRVTKK